MVTGPEKSIRRLTCIIRAERNVRQLPLGAVGHRGRRVVRFLVSFIRLMIISLVGIGFFERHLAIDVAISLAGAVVSTRQVHIHAKVLWLVKVEHSLSQSLRASDFFFLGESYFKHASKRGEGGRSIIRNKKVTTKRKLLGRRTFV